MLHWSKIKLELIVFLSGAVVMVLELIGSRIVAPYLGTSIFVWTSLIGIILAALSAGYYFGGRLSRQQPLLSTLTTIIFFAGISIYVLVLLKDPLLSILPRVGIQVGSIIASLVLFAPASFLLGIVSPYALRLKVSELSGVGGVAGNLYALSTIGSIVGTFLAGFILIPTFGSTTILYSLCFVLLLLSLLDGRRSIKLIMIALVLCSFIAVQFKSSVYIFERDSAYNHIRVANFINAETGHDSRVLLLATEAHSIIDLENPSNVPSYAELYRLDTLFKPSIRTALTLGGGAYVTPLDFLRRIPTSTMTVVELDPEVTDTARRYFNVTDDPRLRIIHQDARIFLNQNHEKFDAIYGDAFSSYFSIPFQVTTVEAMKHIHNSLINDGIFVLNIVGALVGPKSIFFQAEYKTLATVFPNVYVFPVDYYGGKYVNEVQNIVIIASKNERRFANNELIAGATDEQSRLLGYAWTAPTRFAETVPILTDEYAPVDNFVARYLSR